jgi:hypothetical protein
MVRVCVAGTVGKTSLIHRMLYNTFSLHYKPTNFITIYTHDDLEVVEIPRSEHGRPMECDILVLACRSQRDVVDVAAQWFGYHRHLFVVLVCAKKAEKAVLCPEAHLVHVDNIANAGIQKLLHMMLVYI